MYRLVGVDTLLLPGPERSEPQPGLLALMGQGGDHQGTEPGILLLSTYRCQIGYFIAKFSFLKKLSFHSVTL